MGNPVLRGDLRARFASHKIRVIQLFYLSVLGLLAFLGLPPELNQIDQPRGASLDVALLAVQVVLVTYFASACAIREIAVEGEKAAVDLVFAPFAPGTIVVGKSLASLVTIAYWLLLGAPLLALASGIRQAPIGILLLPATLIAVLAWGMTQIGLLYSIVAESEFSRTLAHWGTLIVVFVATLALPASAWWANPVVAVARAAGGAIPVPSYAAYATVGVGCTCLAGRLLRKFISG